MDPFAPVLELSTALHRKELSPVELLETCLATVERHNPQLNAIVWRNDDEARREARRWEQTFVAGDEHLPLFAGIPMPVKDLTEVAGWPITYGSRGAPSGPSRDSAMVVDRLRRAGFILCGRTNTPELGTLTVTENERYGVTRNPWDLTLSPGGSSGGAAAAVASGMFPLAQGSDGGGSLRIPAACCGLVGLKPSRGRVPSVVGGWLGLVTEGALCRTVADAAAVLDCLAGPDPTVWLNALPPARPFVEEAGADPGRLRVGLLREAPLGITVRQAPRAAVTEAGTLLEEAGHRVEEVEVDLAPVESVTPFIVTVNAGLGDFPEVDWSKVEAHNACGRAAAAGVDSLTLVQALAELQRTSHSQLAHWGRDFDLLVTPTLAIEPPAAGSILHALKEDPSAMPEELLAMAVFTSCFNVTGQPAVSIPLCWTESGLPIGVQLVTGAGDEALLIRVASQLEAMRPWAQRRPRLPAPQPAEGRRTTAA